jgi:hypothetical protein
MEGKVGGCFAALEYARHQNIVLKSYVGLYKDVRGISKSAGPQFSQFKSCLMMGRPEVSAKQQKRSNGFGKTPPAPQFRTE